MTTKKRLLIFHPYLATYRIDVYNRFAEDYDIKVILTGHPHEIANLGFNLEKVNSQAKFDYKYYKRAFILVDIYYQQYTLKQSKNLNQILY